MPHPSPLLFVKPVAASYPRIALFPIFGAIGSTTTGLRLLIGPFTFSVLLTGPTPAFDQMALVALPSPRCMPDPPPTTRLFLPSH
uniref:Uncharacterized protein n=1 Tax=Oryza sativa subsp. japonica TaxID=39947 RepID=Q6K5B1_ORYSJ|nr:hypothetical protein [Oryza sativa Japonica Group]BAD22191.1 hypothetical protein [Oryza sativa Japonica Group]